MSSKLRSSGLISAPLYLCCVTAVTVFIFAVAMALRPSFAHEIFALTGLEVMPQAAPYSFYALRVAPLFRQHCDSCHGPDRQKADLRLDSYAYAMRGGRHGAIVEPGDPKASELIKRIMLPVGDDHAMPPEGKTPLSPNEVTVIRMWIAAGASPTATHVKGAPPLVAEVKFPEFDPEAARRKRAPLANLYRQLSQRYPGLLAYESRDSPDMALDAALRGRAFTDSDLKAFLPVAGRIVRMDLSGTAVTGSSATTLSHMSALQSLRLTNTKIGDEVVSVLLRLNSLKVLTVAGTHTTQAGLAPLVKRGVVVHGGDNTD